MPLAHHLHEEQHRGIKSLQKKYGVDLRAEAARLDLIYQQQQEVA